CDEDRRGFVVHRPERGERAPGTGPERDTGETESRALVAGRRLAGGEREELQRLLAQLSCGDRLPPLGEREGPVKGEHESLGRVARELAVRGDMEHVDRGLRERTLERGARELAIAIDRGVQHRGGGLELRVDRGERGEALARLCEA